MMSATVSSAEAVKARLAEIFSKTVDIVNYVPDDLQAFAYGRKASPVESAKTGTDATATTAPSTHRSDSELSPADMLAENIAAYYDQKWFESNVLVEHFLGEQGFRNIGYWPPGTVDQTQASEQLQDYLLSFIPHKTGRILDVACGLGATTRRLLHHYSADDVWAINISEKQIESTRTMAPGCHAQVMNAVEMSFEDAYFDNMICIEAAFHFETRRKFLESALRVLKPGGRLVLSDVLFSAAARHTQFPQLLPSPSNHLETLEAYRMLFKEVGFRDVMVEDLRDLIWRPHFLRFVETIHERFADREIGILELADNLAMYYELDAVTGPWLVAWAEK